MTEQFAADIAAVEPDLPVAFVFKSKSLIGQQTQNASSIEMTDSGFVQKYDFELLARVSIFSETGIPIEGDEIQIGQIHYLVDSTTPSQDGVAITLSMKQLT